MKTTDGKGPLREARSAVAGAGRGRALAGAIVTALAATFATPATATMIDGTWAFTATGIPGAQNVVFSGSFTTSFDDSVASLWTTVTVNSLSLLPGFSGTVGAGYSTNSNSLTFGYTPVGLLTPDTNDFRLAISNPTAPTGTFTFTRIGSGLISAQDVTVTFTPRGSTEGTGGTGGTGGSGGGGITTVPEPGTLALFGLGLVGLGVGRRRRGG